MYFNLNIVFNIVDSSHLMSFVLFFNSKIFIINVFVFYCLIY